jgi:hypothetical protein
MNKKIKTAANIEFGLASYGVCAREKFGRNFKALHPSEFCAPPLPHESFRVVIIKKNQR